MRSEIASDRAARYAAQAAARAQADAVFLAKQAEEKTVREAAEKTAVESKDFTAKWKKAGKRGLIIGGFLFVGNWMYKGTCYFIKRLQEQNHTDLKENDVGKEEVNDKC